jgi:membrane-anchored protein YejM (alkaline phosphatase superfamily)
VSTIKQYRAPLAIIVLCFVLFQFSRFALLMIYYDQFETIGFLELLKPFFLGIRFDASAIFCAVGLPVFLLMLPFRWSQGRWWQGIWSGLGLLIVAGFLVFIAIDLVYYDYVSRHIGPEITIATDDFGSSLSEATGNYSWIILAVLGVIVGLVFLWIRLLRLHAQFDNHIRTRFLIALTAFIVMFSLARGGLGNRILMADAYEGINPKCVDLVLSGPFSALQFLAKIGFTNVTFYPIEEAIDTSLRLVSSPDETYPDLEFPFYRSRAIENSGREKPNVVIVMLEGWTASSVDVNRAELGLEPLGVTGNFDSLAREGILLSRYYSTGQRTRFSLCSLMTGLPHLPILPPLGRGLEQNRLPFLSYLADNEGYGSYFIHGNNSIEGRPRNSWAAVATGFHHFLSQSDIQVTQPGGTWDHDTFAEANRRFKNAEEPFLGFIMTSQPHSPYPLPDHLPVSESWNRFPHDTRENRYLNALGYADWALGQFFQKAKEEDYFNNTIFFVTSDHPQRKLQGPVDPPDLFHIPGFFIGPGVGPGVHRGIVSQLDIVPTIVELADWGSPYASFGRSIFDDSSKEPPGAICTLSNTMIRVEAGGWIHHSLRKRISSGTYQIGADLDAIENRLLSVIQSSTTLYQNNRLCPSDFVPENPR